MKFRNKTYFRIKGLNQEKFFNELSKKISMSDIERHSKNETSFSCSFFDQKKVDKLLKEKKFEILSIKNEGFFYKITQIFGNFGIIFAFLVFFLFSFVQSNFITQYQINGENKLSEVEVLEFLKNNVSKNKHKIDTKSVEVELIENFDEISFASCMIKGQTLVINIKEKLLPDEIYGEFQPIISQNYGKIKEIELISGTLNVKVGDIVKKGDVLVEPYTIDTSGNIKQVKANAKITAEVYNQGSSEHFEKRIEIVRTGRKVEQNKITLFGMEIYTFSDQLNFDLYESENEKIDLVTNLPLPFKMEKTIFFELKENVVESTFDEEQEVQVEKARQKALENCEEDDIIVEEYYTIKHLQNVTIVDYCVVTLEEIGGFE